MTGRTTGYTLGLLLVSVLILAACDVDLDQESSADEGDENTSTMAPTETQESATATPEAAEATPTPDLSSEPDDLPYWAQSWEDTDFSERTVPLEEIGSGGVPPDGIPPIDEPKYVDYAEADEWLEEDEPVISFEVNGDARAFPLQIMTWHEIVNGEVGGVPVAVTFCPLCNTAIAFDRSFDDLGTLRFGTTGLLRHSDLVMWDDQTESFWQQITGEAIVGELTGRELEMLPASIVSYEQFKETHHEGVVLSRNTGHSRNYGANPYYGYDDIDSSPFMFREVPDDQLPPMERVATVQIEDEAVAYPFSSLSEHPVVHDTVGGEDIVVFWQSGTRSALDDRWIAESKDVGASGVFEPVADGESLTFEFVDGAIQDVETGSEWNVLGQAISGPMEGTQLPEVIHGNHFWFAWAAFQPETRIWKPYG